MDVVEQLRKHDVKPSAQRVAVASFVLDTDAHPSADQVFAKVRARFPMISRATVYNTLHLFVEKGLLKALVLAEGKVVFDPKTEPHHHFVDDVTGRIHDVPWSAVQVAKIEELPGFELREWQVVMRGRRTRAAKG